MFNMNDEQAWTYDPVTGEFFDNRDRPLGFYFNPAEQTFVTKSGVTLKLQPANMQMVIMFQSQYRRKHEPEMPRRAVEYDEGKYLLEGNDKDPLYRQQYERFQENLGLAVMEFIVSLSVANIVPPREQWTHRMIEMIQSLDIDPDDAKNRRLLKYAWVATLFASDTETEAFMTVIQGQDLPTDYGVAVAKERFPGADERNNGHRESSDKAPAGEIPNEPTV